jgi:phosphoribosylanthranilate isomerase
MTRVKICGVTREEDAALASELGASYVGLNFAAVSPRRVTVDSARRLSRAVGRGVARVGVFVGEPLEEIRRAVGEAELDLVQVHRPLAREDLEGLPCPVIAVAHVSRNGADPASPELLARCRMLLLDTAGGDRPGGTGKAFDWGLIAGRIWPLPLILAGGLTPENVSEAIGRVRPSAVDVASGVESSPGIKDESRMRRFFEAVRQADASLPSPPGRGRGEGAAIKS